MWEPYVGLVWEPDCTTLVTPDSQPTCETLPGLVWESDGMKQQSSLLHTTGCHPSPWPSALLSGSFGGDPTADCWPYWAAAHPQPMKHHQCHQLSFRKGQLTPRPGLTPPPPGPSSQLEMKHDLWKWLRSDAISHSKTGSQEAVL